MDHCESNTTVTNPIAPLVAIGHGWQLAVPRETPPRVIEAKELKAIRATMRMPGGRNTSICGECGQRAWTMVPLAGMCIPCYQAWLGEREAA